MTGGYILTQAIDQGCNDGLMDFENIPKRNRLKIFFRRFFFINPVLHLLRGYVLDIGCGTGAYLEEYSGPSLGIDALISNVKICNEKGIRAIVADANTFVSNDTFDTVLLSHILEHLDQPQVVIKNAIRNTKPGGRIIIILPCLQGFISGLNDHVGHKHFITEEYVDHFMTEYNCHKIRSYCFPLILGGKYKELRMVFEKPS